MDISKHLILYNGKDITADIKFCKYNPETRRNDVTFNNGQTYPYGYDSIEWLKNPDVLNPGLVHITHVDRELFNIQDIRIFRARATDYWYIRFSDDSARCYDKRNLKIVYSCFSESEAQNCISYLSQLASINGIRNEEGEMLLQKQYEKLDFVDVDTAMAIYLNPARHKARKYNKSNLIFPFGGNASQFKAVENALCNHAGNLLPGCG